MWEHDQRKQTYDVDRKCTYLRIRILRVTNGWSRCENILRLVTFITTFRESSTLIHQQSRRESCTRQIAHWSVPLPVRPLQAGSNKKRRVGGTLVVPCWRHTSWLSTASYGLFHFYCGGVTTRWRLALYLAVTSWLLPSLTTSLLLVMLSF